MTGLLIEILGGIAKLRVAAAELRAFSRWSNAFAEQRVATMPRSRRLGAWQTIAAIEPAHLGVVGVFDIAAGGDQSHRRRRLRRLQQRLRPVHRGPPRPDDRALNVSIEAVPLFARIRPVFEAPLEVEQEPRRSRHARRAASPCATCRSVTPTTARGCSTTSTSRCARARASPSSAPRARANRPLLRLLLGFETPTRGGVYYDGKDLETLDLRLVRRQIGTVLETAGLRPRQPLRQHRRQRAADARAGHGGGAPGRPRGRHRRHADGARRPSSWKAAARSRAASASA